MSLALCLSVTLSTQQMPAKFQMAMGKTLAGYGKCETAPDYAALSARFHRIAQKDSLQWLAKYYEVHTMVLASFTATDPTEKDNYLDQVSGTLDALLEQEPSNAEVLVVHAMYYTARLVVDPASRGQKYSMLSAQVIGKARALDAANPRVEYMAIAGEKGTAQFFGQDTSVFCERAKVAHAAFDAYPQASRIHPSWGKDQLAEQAQGCAQ